MTWADIIIIVIMSLSILAVPNQVNRGAMTPKEAAVAVLTNVFLIGILLVAHR